jgi:Uma2 family endonuclease
MTALLTPPPAVSNPTSAASIGPRPFVWTLALFHRLGDMGWFEGRRAKLIDGQLIEEGRMDPPHADALEKTDAAVRIAFGPGWRFRVQLPLVLGQATDPLPDMAVVRGAPGSGTAHPTTAELVIEIADSSLHYDTTTKAELYATAGVQDYWVLDVDGRRLLVFRDPVPLPQGLGATAYRTHLIFNPGDSVSPFALPAASIAVADLLP